MKNTLIGLMTFALLSSASAKSIRCQVDEQSEGGAKVSVPVSILEGMFGTPVEPIDFKGHKVSVKYNMGDQYEAQTYVQLTIDETVSTTYTVSQNSLYMLVEGDIRLQCWFQ